MKTAQTGDTIAMHYTGTLTDGTRFDSSEGRDPLTFTLGAGQIIAGLDNALMGKEEGAQDSVTIPAAEAYGAHDPQQVQVVPRETIPAEIPLEEGLQLQAQTPQGQTIPLVVKEVGDENVTLDANHPLAGQDLTFSYKIVSIERPA
ncbi:peptidylprolyl isomerase [Roseobacter sp. HKCCA0434]|uniref:FKBP-type peptidyl-prolyl cis-trans isomerase n=1 Tax=Roseobacter sp. HKCCA0434 TaxID=3079297 RepID=UPI002905C1AC|nr:peptidylprolyl isomerase [Roseobacter sp. HKCCA0434]